MSTAGRWLRFGALASAAVLLLVIAVILWSLNTQAGTRWLLGAASSALHQQLHIDSVQGTIAGPLALRGVSYQDPVSGLAFSAGSIDLDLALRELARATLQIDSARIDGVQVTLAAKPPEDDAPVSLDPPVDIVLKQLAATNIHVRRAGEFLVAITQADSVASWTHAGGIAVSRLDVSSPQGEVHFKGQVRQREIFLGDGAGRFRWRAGDRDYAGTLQAKADTDQGVVSLQLNSPLRATLAATIRQAPALSWTLQLAVPEFDPRKSLLPDSSLTALAANLHGNGTLQRADLAGQVAIDGQQLTLDSLHVAGTPQDLSIAGIVKLGAGHLSANGKIQLDRAPAQAKLALQWQNLVIPAQWAGQPLHTQGHLDFAGSSERYRAFGAFSAGPERRVANIELDVSGSQQSLQLTRLDVVQPAGRLASSGVLTLQPRLGWDVSATARNFDPGAFAAAWNGSLSFGLNSAGMMTDTGPEATLRLDDLRGRLRNRALSGAADLTMQPGMRLAGVLDLRSGSSQVRIDARRSDSSMDAVVTAQIDTLADWIPTASGNLQARITAAGQWPQLRIAGNAQGRSLRLGDSSAESLSLQLDMINPQQPSGTAKLEVSNVAAAGFRFDTFKAALDGSLAQHHVNLQAAGTPLASTVDLQGSLQQDTWSGTVRQLVIDLKNVTRLSLQEPAHIRYATTAASVSQSCFADGEIRLCLAGEQASDGALRADYSLRQVPLALANALAPGTLPFAIDGNIAGNGHVERSAQGMFDGQLRLSSSDGKLAQPARSASAAPQTLLTYQDLQLTADLSGGAAALTVRTRLDQQGSLAADLQIDGLDSAAINSAATSLHGQVQAHLPSIAVVEAMVPQLANVNGELTVHASVAGSVDQPEISGTLNLVKLAADVPEFGLKLRNGQFTAAPRADGQFAFNGGISSGNGQLAFDGVAATDGTVQLSIHGENFLAVDIPGASASITPELTFARTPQRMILAGKVLVPQANVNVQKLPHGTRVQRASADVVVIESQTAEQAQAAGMPLLAEVTVTLGDKVTLTGFGLDATLTGQLLVRERPGEPTAGSGEIRVAGRYKAYGQDLTVQQGQLLFAGTPLDNPRLNIVAVRTVGEVNAGLRVTGSAQNPQLVVFSDPPMGQANALAYLVTGKPLEEVGSSSGDSDALQTAARSLGTAAGGLLAKNVGGRLGVDEVGIKDSDAIGGSAFTVGQYLSPRLYLSYGIGLFQPGEVVTLRYKLKESVAIQAQRGPKDTRAGVEYRIEK